MKKIRVKGDFGESVKGKTQKMFRVDMKRGKRSVFLGYFPNEYRARTVITRLDWSPDWKGQINPVRVTER